MKAEYADHLERTTSRLQKENEELKEELKFLEALRAAGVDNWEGYEHAADILREMENDDGAA